MPIAMRARTINVITLALAAITTACSNSDLSSGDAADHSGGRSGGSAGIPHGGTLEGGSKAAGGAPLGAAGATATLGGAHSGGAAASESGGAFDTGGSPGVGGSSGTTAAMGGSTVGGRSSGGAGAGGKLVMGGASGAPFGGSTAKGGASNGGTSTGGFASGGKAAGGAPIGGAKNGGATAAGGTNTGGTNTGGTNTGGTNTGGTNAGGTNTYCPGATQVLTVAADGTGQYRTVQAAINAVPSGNSKLIQVSVKAGTYDEQVTIDKPFVCLTGASAASTIITHTIDTNIVTGGTVLLTGNDFSAANITFRNSAPAESAQRVALMASGARQQFYDCRFISYQDTLYTNKGTQYFKNCYIQGNTDYIFGDATAVFDNCTMHNITQGTAVTAPRTPQGTTYGFVFIGGALTASSGVGNGRVYLGRPWGPYAAAAFVNVTLGAHVNAAGWTTMSSNTLELTRFWEYGSTGPGANSTNATRAPRQLSSAQAANYTIQKVLSPWVPTFSQ